MKKILSYAALPSLLLIPFVASAAIFGKVDTFFKDAGGLINDILIPILLAIAFLVFIVGIVQYFLLAGKDNADGQEKGKSLILWGIIGFVLIVSIWGIVNLLAGGLGFDKVKTIQDVPVTPLNN
jgi:hypothetical protein